MRESQLHPNLTLCERRKNEAFLKKGVWQKTVE